jgi:nucleoid-associated protein YgaU
MSRYATTRVVKDSSETRKLTSIIIPTPPQSADDLFIQVTSADRLDKLATTFYGTPILWYVIAAANGLGKGTLRVPKNTNLRIPSISDIQTLINNTNNSR